MLRMVIAVASTFASIQVFAMDSIADLEWKNRVVLIFGLPTDARVDHQIELLERQTSDLAERDMVIIRIAGDEARSVYGNFPSPDAGVLRKEAEIIGDTFQVVLIGKDGGVKLRSDRVVRNIEIFDLIDSMPMRKKLKND
ncbi:DUF4174 domain-containing protein [Rhizobium sp. XQZ8]|uniref:DUF4174 domain-containing protein n=1 Tax=Rhizobium populisoli TaxID=2859785 RepID=UPI001C66CCCC|nr:DUF4174 domain-containing protein [Rhizobium populisoli]MBW6425509.1 DUF4174 domain-containing protein [Rhizobium populisoli]